MFIIITSYIVKRALEKVVITNYFVRLEGYKIRCQCYEEFFIFQVCNGDNFSESVTAGSTGGLIAPAPFN